MSEDILLQINKPAQYMGREWNSSRKDFLSAQVKVALCFPDLYEVGMSNLGIRILYTALNAIEGVVCERVFSCAIDMEALLRNNQRQIVSLESSRPLKDFDIIGFSLGSELDYTNALNILDLSGIPLETSGRDQSHPLIIAGGACALNPEPLHAFFDLILIGEAEEAVGELADLYGKHKQYFKSGKISRQELLCALARIEGVYAPSLYTVTYDGHGGIERFEPKINGLPQRVKKRIVKDLNSSSFPVDWLVPYIQIIHDRVTVEIMRGCPNRCRFCQARNLYHPLRIRSIDNVLQLASCAYARSGYEEMSFTGLSVSDYPGIEELLVRLTQQFGPKGIGLSLPSIKAKANVGNLTQLIASVKKTGLTFAPEAGTPRLRQLLAKDFNEAEFFSGVEQAYQAGYQHVKLYFMIGLPYETDEDLDGIADFAQRVSFLRKQSNKGSAQVNISVNTLIPKPHTAFQWFGMEDLESIKRKQDYLREKVRRNRKLMLTFHNRHMGFLEGVLSRGDRRLSAVILRAFRNGAKFDAWSDHFAIDKWLAAFRDSGIDPGDYLKEIGREAVLPWDFIDMGIDKGSLLSEYNKMLQ